MADTVYIINSKGENPMKFVKRISMFFIYPLCMFAAGMAADMAVQQFFYPGRNGGAEAPVHREAEKTVETAAGDALAITADTRYILIAHDSESGEETEKEEIMPDKYIGMTRDRLSEELKEYAGKPSLTDKELGFTYIELVSFSPERVVIRKSYEKKAEQTGFFLLNENHYVVVYDRSLEQVYLNTDILTRELPEELQEEILHMKFIENEEELYNFLESYSS